VPPHSTSRAPAEVIIGDLEVASACERPRQHRGIDWTGLIHDEPDSGQPALHAMPGSDTPLRSSVPSLQMRLIAVLLRVVHRRRTSTAERMRRAMDAPKAEVVPPRALTERHGVTCRTVQGFPCWSVVPKDGASGQAAVYLHGGAYVSPASPAHWALIGKLADAGVRVELPLYGLAPAHTHHAAHPFVSQVLAELADAVGAEHVTVLGDSAGGGLALALVQGHVAAGKTLPRRLILIAPWLEAGLDHPATGAAQRSDPWLSREGLLEAARAWAGGDPLEDARLSPLRGELAGLPPTTLYVGTRDLFCPDVERFAHAARQAGVDVQITVETGAVHVYPLVPAPEGRRAAAEIVDLVAHER
jgi:epsilon-lactone hydrolase